MGCVGGNIFLVAQTFSNEAILAKCELDISNFVLVKCDLVITYCINNCVKISSHQVTVYITICYSVNFLQ